MCVLVSIAWIRGSFGRDECQVACKLYGETSESRGSMEHEKLRLDIYREGGCLIAVEDRVCLHQH